MVILFVSVATTRTQRVEANIEPSARAAETRQGTMERYLVDLGEPADGAKIVVAVARSSTVGTLRATTEVRAQKRVDAIGGLRLKGLRLGCGFALDDEDIASDVIERSETLTVDWAANEDEGAAPLSNVQVDPQSLAAAKELAEDRQRRHFQCRGPPSMPYGSSSPYSQISANDSSRRPSFGETLDDDDPEGTYDWDGDDVPIAFATIVVSSPDQAASSPRRRVHVDGPPMAPPRRAGPSPPSLSPLSAVGRLLSTAFEGSSNEFATSSSSAGHQQQHQQRPPPPQPQRTRSQPPQLPLATSRRRDGAANRADDERDTGRWHTWAHLFDDKRSSAAEVAAGHPGPPAGPSRGFSGTSASSPTRAPPLLGGVGSNAPNIARSDDPSLRAILGPRPEPGARADRHGRASVDLASAPAAVSSSCATATIAPASVTIGAAAAARREADTAAASEVRPPAGSAPQEEENKGRSERTPSATRDRVLARAGFARLFFRHPLESNLALPLPLPLPLGGDRCASTQSDRNRRSARAPGEVLTVLCAVRSIRAPERERKRARARAHMGMSHPSLRAPRSVRPFDECVRAITCPPPYNDQ